MLESCFVRPPARRITPHVFRHTAARDGRGGSRPRPSKYGHIILYRVI